jgi:tRNA threonylcarbamoyladenosine biosynthesis protein TsaB
VKPLLLLALDGALGPFSAALMNGPYLAVRRSAGNDALERGIGLIDELLTEAGVAISDLDALAVGIGPGGFTGLRITLSFAKALALSIGCPLIGVSSLDAVAAEDGAVAAGQIARHALRMIEMHGLGEFGSLHSVAADYGRAAATTEPAPGRWA